LHVWGLVSSTTPWIRLPPRAFSDSIHLLLVALLNSSGTLPGHILWGAGKLPRGNQGMADLRGMNADRLPLLDTRVFRCMLD